MFLYRFCCLCQRSGMQSVLLYRSSPRPKNPTTTNNQTKPLPPPPPSTTTSTLLCNYIVIIKPLFIQHHTTTTKTNQTTTTSPTTINLQQEASSSTHRLLQRQQVSSSSALVNITCVSFVQNSPIHTYILEHTHTHTLHRHIASNTLYLYISILYITSHPVTTFPAALCDLCFCYPCSFCVFTITNQIMHCYSTS